MANVTIKDIAKALNISTSTVSRALRDSYEISVETKKKIVEYAKSVHYVPNPIALSLKENKGHSICVIVPEIANNFFSEVINGIDSIAVKHGYHVVIFQTHESYEREESNIEHVMSRKVDGMIISLSGTTKNYNLLQEAIDDGFPIVFFDRVPPLDKIYKVVSDNFEGAYKATQFLINSGKKRIAHITTPPILSITIERLEGYKAALKDNQIEIDESLIKYCSFEINDAHQTIEELLNNEKPDSFFICSDRLALNCFESLKNNYASLPKDVAIVGYTNLKSTNLIDLPITIVRQPAFEMGQEAASILISILENKNNKIPHGTIKLSNELIIRDKVAMSQN